MRPLHRPMFRYGGPIKEGVMSGIREPHAGGGRAALVGNPMFPQRGGRALHADNIQGIFDVAGQAAKKTLSSAAKKPLSVFSPGKKWKAIKNIGLTGARPVQNWYKKWRSSLDMPKSRISSGSGMGGVNLTEAQIAAGMGTKPAGFFNKAWQFAKLNPKTTAAGAYIGSPAVVGGLTSIPYKKAGMQILDLAVPDFIFDQDQYFKDKEKAKLDEEKELTANELRIKELEKLLAGKEEPAVPQKTEEEIRNERIQKYRDIMDIKGMNKEAAYDSLIAASQAINESGDFKGDIKSGKLINQIIQGASKAFDKPKKTKDAIDTLILKGEIEADLAKAKGSTSWQAIDALSKASGQSPQFVANAKLGIANTISEAVNNFRKVKKLPTSDDITGVVYSFSERTGIPVQKQISTEKASEVIGKGKKYETVTDMVSDLELDPNGADDGFYVIGTKVVQVTDGVPRIKA